MRGLGYRDAFVIALNNGNRITLSEARNMESSANIVAASAPIIQPDTDNEERASNTNLSSSTDQNIAPATAANTIKGVFFSVQVGAFSKPLTDDNELNVSPLVLNRYNGLYKYSTGILIQLKTLVGKKLLLLNKVLPMLLSLLITMEEQFH